MKVSFGLDVWLCSRGGPIALVATEGSCSDVPYGLGESLVKHRGELN